MHQLRQIFGYFFTAYFLILFALTFLILMPFFLPLLYYKKWHKAAHRLRRGWAWFLLLAIGVWPIIIRKQNNLPKPCIYVPNHASYIDIVIMAVSVPSFFRFMAKAELQRIPLFGIFFKTLDLAVERGNHAKAARSMRLAAIAIRKGDSLTIFPEGTIPPNAPELGKFKMGAFKLSAELQIPLVPITFLDNWRILPDTPFPAGRPGKARVVVHNPIYPVGASQTDINLLASEVFAIHQHTLRQYNIIEQPKT